MTLPPTGPKLPSPRSGRLSGGLSPRLSTMLSPREKECVQLLAQGYRTQQIAEKLLLKEVTVHLYIRNARKKLNANTRAHLAVIAVMENHIEL